MVDKEQSENKIVVSLPHIRTTLPHTHNNNSNYGHDNVYDDYVRSLVSSDFKPAKRLEEEVPLPDADISIKLVLAQ